MIQKEGLFATNGITQSDRCMHTPGSFARQNLLYVQEAGTLQSLWPHRCARETVGSFLFLVVLGGKGYLKTCREDAEVREGVCALIDCMEPYEHISDEKEAWRLSWVHFNGKAARGYYELFLNFNGNRNVFHAGTAEEWGTLIRDIREEQREKSLLAELRSGEMLLHLMNRIIGYVLNPGVVEVQKDGGRANGIRQLLNEKFMQKSILALLAETFSEPVSALNELFMKDYGISIEEYIGTRRYNLAKELLRFSIMPVEQVAEESGIGDMVAMQQMFQGNEGMAAEEYRRKWAGWIRG